MPAFNEEEVLPHALAEATAALDHLCDDWELVIVDDGSTDATPGDAGRRRARAAATARPHARAPTKATPRP